MMNDRKLEETVPEPQHGRVDSILATGRDVDLVRRHQHERPQVDMAWGKAAIGENGDGR